MSEMIERVARVLQQEICPNDPYDELIQEGRDNWNSRARAAIAAMREPTEEMKKAKGAAGYGMSQRSLIDWRAMIDQALWEDK